MQALFFVSYQMPNCPLHVRGLFAIPPAGDRPKYPCSFYSCFPPFSLQCLPFIPRAQARTAYTFSSSSSSSSSLLYLSLPYLLPYLAHTGSWMEEATTTAEAALQQRKTGRGNTHHRNSKHFYILLLCAQWRRQRRGQKIKAEGNLGPPTPPPAP